MPVRLAGFAAYLRGFETTRPRTPLPTFWGLQPTYEDLKRLSRVETTLR